jgi:Tol biopolymer transport system component
MIMNTRRVIAAVIVLALVAATSGYAQQTAEELYQAGLYQEEVQGDLESAIDLYRRILDEFSDNRTVGAKAQLHIGLCYEKLGQRQAQQAYQRVIDDYPEHRDEVLVARQRLARLTRPVAGSADEQGMTFQQIEFDGLEHSPFAKLSPDGGRMAYVHYEEDGRRYSLRVRSLVSGDESVLVDSVGTVSVFVEWSPDGAQIAYGGGRTLRVIDATGGASSVVWSSPEGTRVLPLDWAPSGDSILIAVRDMASWTHQLMIVPLSGGPPRSFVSGSVYEVLDFGQFSPEGTHVAGMQTKDGNADVYVWSVDGREEIRVTTHAAKDEGPFWTPDGEFLVFCSDRAGDYDVWAVPMQGGAPGGPPFRVKASLGRRFQPSGVTADGGITFLAYGEGTPGDLFVMDVARSPADPAGRFRSLARYPAQAFQPRWSPAGDRVAYTSRKGEIGWPRIFINLGSNSSQDVELPMQDHYPVNVAWGRDGEHVVFPGFRRADGRAGIFRLSLEEQTIEALQLGDPPGPRYQGAFVNLHWLPIARKFMLQQVADSSRMDLLVMDEDGATLEHVLDGLPTNSWTWPSPDGRHVAYRDDRSLHVISLADETSLLLSEWQDSTWFDVSPGWSPDGGQVAWTDRTELRVLDLAEGTPRSLVAAAEGSIIVAPPIWSPDGAMVAYVVRDATAGDASRLDEVWIVPSRRGAPERIALAPDTHPRLRLEAWQLDGVLAASGSHSSSVSGGYQHWLLKGFLPVEGQERRR